MVLLVDNRVFKEDEPKLLQAIGTTWAATDNRKHHKMHLYINDVKMKSEKHAT